MNFPVHVWYCTTLLSRPVLWLHDFGWKLLNICWVFREYNWAYEIEPRTHYESSNLFFRRIFGSRVNCEGTPFSQCTVKITGRRFLGAELETSPSLEHTTMICLTTWKRVFYMYFWEIERLTWGSQDQEYGQVFLLYLFLRNWAFNLRITRSGVVRDWCADKCFWGGRKLLWQIYQSKHIEPFEISFTGKVKTFRVHMSDWLVAWFWELGVPINELFLLCLFQNLQGWIDSLEFHCSFNQHEWI